MQFFCMCSFRGPVCPDWLQEQLLGWMIESAERGRPGFREMLTMTPCDLFSLVRGRTLWLMGDSMMQVGPAGSLQGCPLKPVAVLCKSVCLGQGQAAFEGGQPFSCGCTVVCNVAGH